MKEEKKDLSGQFPPLSLIDVVFMLLIFFFVTYIAITGKGHIEGEESAVHRADTLVLPETSIEELITLEKPIEGVRILIQKSEPGSEGLEYFLLGYDNEDVDPNKENISSADSARVWRDSIELDADNENDQSLIQSSTYIRGDWNDIRRWGEVPTTSSDISRERANFKLFFKYVRGFEKFEDINALDVKIAADELVNIGFINDIMTICGLDSIPRISFILRKKEL